MTPVWILIALAIGGPGYAPNPYPAMVGFYTREACENARAQIKGIGVDRSVCVPSGAPAQQ